MVMITDDDDGCADDPCIKEGDSNAECKDAYNGFYCMCSPGFCGPLCEPCEYGLSYQGMKD